MTFDPAGLLPPLVLEIQDVMAAVLPELTLI